MTPEVQNLLAELVKWIIKLVGDAVGAANKPAPTADELKALVKAAIEAHIADPQWIDKIIDATLVTYLKP